MPRPRTMFAAWEALGNGLYHQLHQQFGTPPSLDLLHQTTVLQLAQKLHHRETLPALRLGSFFDQVFSWRPMLGTDPPYQLIPDRWRRKAAGSYPTPAAVVDYLVEETLGPLVRGDAASILRLRVIDPACGAGCFLVAAADFLALALAEALKREGTDAEVLACRQLIVQQCLFGMDLDPLAVALTRLALTWAAGGVTPPNIRQGDALAADWDQGFDAVLGNPPWGRCQPTQALRQRFPTLQPRLANLSVPFTELGLKLSAKGRLGYVLPSTWIEIESCQRLRQYLCSTRRVEALVMARQLFARHGGPAVDAVLLVVGGRGSTESLRLFCLNDRLSVAHRLEQLQQRNWSDTRVTALTADRPESACDMHVRIGTQEYARGGGHPPQTAAMIADRAYHTDRRLDARYVRFVPCGDVQRFRLAWSGGYLQWGDNLHCPRERTIFTREHLLLSRIFDVRQRVFKCCHVPAREDDFWCNNTDSFNIWLTEDAPLTLFALLGILGSRWLGRLAYEQFVNLQRPVFPKVSVRMARCLPLPDRETLSTRKGQRIVAALDALVRRITSDGLDTDREEELERLVARF